MKVVEERIRVSRGLLPCISFGSGPRSFVMISGMSTTGLDGLGSAIAEAYAPMCKDYTCFFFDRIDELPDGYSIFDMTEDVAEAMRTLGLSACDVAGFSQGGMIAQALAAKHPELVHALALVSSCCHLNERNHSIMANWRSLCVNGDGRGLYRDFFDRVYKRPNHELLTMIENTATDAQLRRFAILAQACLDFDSREYLSNISCPVFVIGAHGDRVFGSAASTELAERLKCPCYLYPESGHAVCDEEPDFKLRLLDHYRSVR